MRIYGQFLAIDIDLERRDGGFMIDISFGYRGSFCPPQRILMASIYQDFNRRNFLECLRRAQDMPDIRRFLARVVEDMRREEQQPRYVGPNVILGNQPNYFEWLRNGR